MKKRNILLLLLAICLSLFSGCACDHEWAEADCLTPKTCTLCQETEGEPLGHEFDKWDAMNDEEMSHSCVKCDAAEIKEIDRETILADQIVGSWDSEYAQFDDDRLDFDGYRYTFFADHTFIWSSDAGEKVEGEWNYFDYADGVSKGYIVELESELNGDEAVALLVSDDKYVMVEVTDEYQMFYVYAENVEVVKEKVENAPIGPRDENFEMKKEISADIKTFENSVDDMILYTGARLIGAKIPKAHIERHVRENFVSYDVTSNGNPLIGIGFLNGAGEFIIAEENLQDQIALIYVVVHPEQKNSKQTKLALISLMRECDESLTPKEAEKILLDLQDGLDMMAEGKMQTDDDIFAVCINDVYYWVNAADETYFAISMSPLGDIL